jgi:hypothetical protein
LENFNKSRVLPPFKSFAYGFEQDRVLA